MILTDHQLEFRGNEMLESDEPFAVLLWRLVLCVNRTSLAILSISQADFKLSKTVWTTACWRFPQNLFTLNEVDIEADKNH